MNDKIARYQEIERRGLLDKISPEKRAMWEEYKSRHPELSGGLGLTADQRQEALNKAKELNEQMGIPSDGGLAGKIVNNPIVRGTVSGMQKMLDASYNPIGIMAKGLNYSFGNGKYELPESLKPDIKPQNATERAISNALDYGQDALAFLSGGEALKGAGLLGKGVGTASKVARGIASGTVPEALASSTGAGVATGIVNPDSMLSNLATGVLGGMAGGGLLSGARALKNAFDIKRGGNELQRQLTSGSNFSDIKYGKISNKKLAEINKIRVENGYAPIKKSDVSIPADRVEHLYNGRIVGDNYTPQEVKDVLKGTIHNKKAIVSQGNLPQYQEINVLGTQSGKRGVVGAHKDTNNVFVKTAYKTEGDAFASPKLAGEQKALLSRSLTNDSIAQKASNVKENNFVQALSDTNKVRRLKNAVQAGEKGIQEQADDFLNRMVARQNGAYDDALEAALKTPKMKEAESVYASFMRNNGKERLSKAATEEFYNKNPIARNLIKDAREIDPQSFENVSKGSLKEFDMLKQMLRRMKGNQAEKTVSQSAAENAEKAVKNIMEDSFKGFKSVNKDYAAARLGQELFEKKVLTNVRNLSKASTSPFWSVLASSAAGAGTFGALANNPATLVLGGGALLGKSALRALRRQAGRAIMEGKTPLYDAAMSGIKSGIKATGKSAIDYGKYPALSVILNDRKGE